MRILFVAMPGSIHTARWIGQLGHTGWDLHLFPSLWEPPHPALNRITVHTGVVGRRTNGVGRSVKVRGFWPFRRGATTLYWLANTSTLRRLVNPATRLATLVRSIRPDLVHSLEFQHSAYLTLEALAHKGESFPPWIVSNWGSDIFLFSRLAAHRARIKEVLTRCDYYACESQRDLDLARQLCLKGEALPILPAGGGFDLKACEELRSPEPTSSRRLIVVKGYQHFAGRALVALRAIARCAGMLERYRIAIYGATPDVAIAAELLASDTGLQVELIPPCSHEEILRRLGQARIYLGLSISDAVPASLLEAMVMGAFPIQARTSCANEWVEDGVTGLLVPPEDPDVVADAVIRAASEDALVDSAAVVNRATAERRLEREAIGRRVVTIYERIASSRFSETRGFGSNHDLGIDRN